MPIYGVHPEDKDLNFLKKVNEFLVEKYGAEYRYLRLGPNYQSHEYCLRVLNGSNSGNVFFFCHALEKSIRGCKIEHTSSSLSHKDFNYGALISPEKNLSVFKGKMVFCLACFSRDLGNYAIKAGAKVFLGFGDIPFYIKDKFKESAIEAFTKKELKEIILKCLISFIENDWNYNQLSIYLKLLIDKKRFELLKDKSNGVKIRIEVSNILSRIKNGIQMFGDGNLKFSS